MSPWGPRGFFESGPKRPPPEHGIKMQKAGVTWWGQRWIEALENVLGADSGRLARGRTYARAGRTHDLVVKGGKVSAKVTGSRPTPYQVTMKLAELSDAVWQKVLRGMAAKAQFSAELLSGQMPKNIGEVFRDAGTSLFPGKRADLATSCTCPDWGDPCKHVAATHYVLGEAFDRDPFLLFELRGRTKERVLDALRRARSVTGEAKPRRAEAKTPRALEPEIPSVTLGKLTAADYDRPLQALPALHLSFDGPASPGAVLRQLGAPAAWSGDTAPVDLLAPVVRAAAEKARRLALSEPEEPKPVSPRRRRPGRTRR